MRFRRGFRRRRSGFRWVTPNVWTSAAPSGLSTTMSTPTPANTVIRNSLPLFVPLTRGYAPFQGVANSAGQITGTLLAERQYFKVLRIVGRLSFLLTNTTGQNLVFNSGMLLGAIHWAIIRMPISELGNPAMPAEWSLQTVSTQDEKQTILAQDVWRYELRNPAQGDPLTFPADDILFIQGPLPLGSMIDVSTKRWVGNEQGLFLAVQGEMFDRNAQFGTTVQVQIDPQINLRTLVKLGR